MENQTAFDVLVAIQFKCLVKGRDGPSGFWNNAENPTQPSFRHASCVRQEYIDLYHILFWRENILAWSCSQISRFPADYWRLRIWSQKKMRMSNQGSKSREAAIVMSKREIFWCFFCYSCRWSAEDCHHKHMLTSLCVWWRRARASPRVVVSCRCWWTIDQSTLHSQFSAPERQRIRCNYAKYALLHILRNSLRIITLHYAPLHYLLLRIITHHYTT